MIKNSNRTPVKLSSTINFSTNTNYLEKTVSSTDVRLNSTIIVQFNGLEPLINQLTYSIINIVEKVSVTIGIYAPNGCSSDINFDLIII